MNAWRYLKAQNKRINHLLCISGHSNSYILYGRLNITEIFVFIWIEIFFLFFFFFGERMIWLCKWQEHDTSNVLFYLKSLKVITMVPREMWYVEMKLTFNLNSKMMMDQIVARIDGRNRNSYERKKNANLLSRLRNNDFAET